MSQGPRGEASVQGRVKYCLQPTPLVGALGQPVIVSLRVLGDCEEGRECWCRAVGWSDGRCHWQLQGPAAARVRDTQAGMQAVRALQVQCHCCRTFAHQPHVLTLVPPCASCCVFVGVCLPWCLPWCILVLQVHRLDVGTGGLLMVAKTRAAATRLTRDLAEHNIQKRCVYVYAGS